jgi:hypothetical protein
LSIERQEQLQIENNRLRSLCANLTDYIKKLPEKYSKIPTAEYIPSKEVQVYFKNLEKLSKDIDWMK